MSQEEARVNMDSLIRSDTEHQKALSVLTDIKNKNSSFWEEIKKERSLEVFSRAAAEVEAYGDFLQKHKVDTNTIKTWDDFIQLPTVGKENYLRKYPHKSLSRADSLHGPVVFTSSSGSTGEPVYFSRDHQIDWQSSVIHELFLSNGSFDLKTPTLVVVCFGMGVWIGGLITYQAVELFARRSKSAISILTPGINKEEIFKTLKRLAPDYPQIVLAGYPPFLKDVLDEASDQGINLKKHKVKLLFAAEAFTEKFRDHACKLAGIKDVYLDTINIYGSADIGTMAFETPLSILIRRLATKNKKLFKDLFGNITKTPTLAQFIPSFTSFESSDGEIIVTGESSMPLVRYSIGDHGGVLGFDHIVKICSDHGVDILSEAERAGIGTYIYRLPFVFVYERTDFSTTLYGLQIYPETIREVLLEEPFDRILTGKLTLITRFDKHQDQYVEINLEMQKGKKITAIMKNQLLRSIVKNLRAQNSEFHELSNYLKDRAHPKLVFWPAEDPLYFKTGIKQKWVRK